MRVDDIFVVSAIERATAAAANTGKTGVDGALHEQFASESFCLQFVMKGRDRMDDTVLGVWPIQYFERDFAFDQETGLGEFGNRKDHV